MEGMAVKELQLAQPGKINTSAGFFARLLLIVFAVELVVMVFFSSVLEPLGPVTGSLADATLAVLFCAPLFWFAAVRPLAGGDGRGADRPALARMFGKMLAAVFLVEFLANLTVPFVIPRADAVGRYFGDAWATTFLCAPLFWRILSREERSRIDSLADLLDNPVKLYLILLGSIFFIDLVEMPLVPLLSANKSELSHKFADAFLTTMIIAPLLWWLLVRPLQRAAQAELARSNAVRAQVVEAIVGIDEEGVIDSCNQAAERIFGYAAAEIAGKPVQLLFGETEQTLAELMRTGTLNGSGLGDLVTHEVLCRRRDGSSVTTEVSVSRIMLKDRPQFLLAMRDISGRKEMERALRESEERFRMLSESSPVGVFHLDPDGCCLYTNQRWQEIAGLTAAESLGQGWTRVDHPEDQKNACAAWHRSVVIGCDFKHEFRLLTPRGEVRWVLARTAALHSPEGVVTGYVGTYEDITERKENEETLQHSMSLLTATLESTADGILAVVTKRHIRTFNQKFLDMWRIPREKAEDCAGCNLSTFVKDQLQDPEGFVAGVEDLYSRPEATALDILRFKDGRVFERYSQPQKLGGSSIGRVWSFRDITARFEADEALRRGEERFRQIYEQSEDAIVFFKPGALSIIDANPTAEKLFGHTRGELQEKGGEPLFGPGQLAKVRDLIDAARPDRMSGLDSCVALRKDGSELIVSMRGKTISLQGVELVYCTFRDITERVRLEETARDIQARLIQANKMTSLGLLVSGVAHEINNPNNFIIANAQLLNASWEDALKVLREHYRENGDFLIAGVPFSTMKEEASRLFLGIIEGSRRIDEIIRNLKDFARGDRFVAEHAVDLNRVVTAAASLLLHQINLHTENFHLALGEDLPSVKGSYQQLEQVVINLLLNAAQALPERSHGIWVTTGSDAAAGQVYISVRDEGHGIPRDVGDRVMEPFFTTRLDQGGTGLGLSISQSIVLEHNGSLEFESEPGKGTTFTVKLPAATSQL
jgi:PAS domain S-box-containing protein